MILVKKGYKRLEIYRGYKNTKIITHYVSKDKGLGREIRFLKNSKSDPIRVLHPIKEVSRLVVHEVSFIKILVYKRK